MRRKRNKYAAGGALKRVCDCYADGGRVGSRERARQTAPSPLAALGALFDMGAGALRGATSATLGLPGDLESLVRLVTGGENVMPTTEQVSAKLPALGALSIPADKNPYQDLGEFIPLTPPKAVTSAAKKLGREGLRALDRGMQGQGALAQVLAPVQPAYAVRPKGGNFHEQRLAGYLGALNIGTPEYFDLIGDPVREFRQGAVGDWGAKQLKNYLRKDLGSPTDPLLQVEKEFPNLHLPEDMLRYSEEALRQRRMFSHDANSRVGAYMRNHNELSGGQPLTPWGLHSDDAMRFTDPSGYATDLLGGDLPEDEALEMLSELGDKYKWLQDAPPDTKIWGLVDPYADDLGFNHVLDYLEAATKAGNLEKGGQGLDLLRQTRDPLRRQPVDEMIDLIDAGLALDPKSLERLSVADAVRKTAQWNEFLKNAGTAADPDLARGIARVHKEYPDDGMKWVELGAGDGEAVREGFELRQTPNGWAVYGPDSAGRMVNHFNPKPTKEAALAEYRKSELSAGLNAEGKAMGHCVGGYCDEVAERGTKIYSLRDAKGNPHVTVEVRPGRVSYKYLTTTPDPDNPAQTLHDRVQSERRGNGDYESYALELVNKLGLNAPSPEIMQIKGKQNATPVEKYLPYVQDFVKSGQWGRVGDLRNTGLRRFADVFGPAEQDRMKAAGVVAPEDFAKERYISPDEAIDMMRRAGYTDPEGESIVVKGFLRERQGYASGGSVQPNTQQNDPLSAFENAVVHLEKLYAA